MRNAFAARFPFRRSRSRVFRAAIATLGIVAGIAPQPAHAFAPKLPCQEFSIFMGLVDPNLVGAAGQPYEPTDDSTFGTVGKTVLEHPTSMDDSCGTSSDTATSLAYTQHLRIGPDKNSMVEIGVVIWRGNYPSMTPTYAIFTEAENYPNYIGPFIEYTIPSSWTKPIWLKVEGFQTQYFYTSYDATSGTQTMPPQYNTTWVPGHTFTGLPRMTGTPMFESSSHANPANGGSGVDARMAMWNLGVKPGWLGSFTPWWGQTCYQDTNTAYQPYYDASSTTTGSVQPGVGQCVTL